LAKFDPTLTVTWSTYLGHAAGQWARGVALDGSGAVYVAGYGNKPWSNWGRARENHHGSDDGFVTKIAAPTCSPENTCIRPACGARRAQAWFAYEHCVQTSIEKYYFDATSPYDEDMKTCRADYFSVCSPQTRFTDNGDTVTDNLSGLVWEKKTNTNLHEPNAIHTWSRSNSTGPWEEDGTAFSVFLAGLNAVPFDGIPGWRLPTFAELTSLMKVETAVSAVLPEFPDTAAGAYWSSTNDPTHADCAWYVIFTPPVGMIPVVASTSAGAKTTAYHVRAVRGGY